MGIACKKTLAAILAAVSFSGAAEAAQVRFRGTVVFTATDHCAYQTKGSKYGSIYSPRNVGDNGAHAVVTLVYDLNAAALDLANAEFDSNFRKVTVTAVGDSGWTSSAQVRVTSRSPVPITTSTRFVTLRGQIKGPWEDPGYGGLPCIASFDASYVRY
ncbi:hypothetical protein [Oryzibacter oryziterrae]|uniref:hypothetical protein n=1 Tax=Oryzibacter oryziterrae TaxID=2766474 RepID=UPI001F463C05|nr:hypothetical protein [Oryzibacter oryziterrae]